jgi:hypothetical protein
MNPWTHKLAPLKGRKNALPGHDSSVNLGGSDYSGPADGDFARYVDQLLSNADVQRRAQTRASAPVHDARQPKAPSRQANPRRNPAPAGKNATADSLEHLRAQAHKAASKPALKVGLKLLPLLIWLPVVVALFFWQGGMIWLIGLILVGSWVVNLFRKVLGSKKG